MRRRNLPIARLLLRRQTNPRYLINSVTLVNNNPKESKKKIKHIHRSHPNRVISQAITGLGCCIASGGLKLKDLPQIVLLTFDDSVNDLNKELYQDLFEQERVNPNGCPISATFYVSHEWTDYGQVQNLYADGHEIASHTISSVPAPMTRIPNQLIQIHV